MSASTLPPANASSSESKAVQIQMAIANAAEPEGLRCGMDEVGIGSAIAEVYVCACILDPAQRINGLRDSKILTAERRKELSERIKERALDFCIATASLEEVNTLNVLGATMLAMKRAVAGLKLKPGIVLIDGKHMPDLPYPARTIIKGDAKVRCISAASILAKVARDEAMMKYHEQFPQYGIDNHKGYLTPLHMAMLKKFGPCAIHRKNYEPIRALLSPEGNRQLSLIAEDHEELEEFIAKEAVPGQSQSQNSPAGISNVLPS